MQSNTCTRTCNLCHLPASAGQLLNERGSSDTGIFRTRSVTSSNLDSIPVLPGPIELLRIPSLEKVDDAKTTTCTRLESTTSFEFFKRAFASNPNTAVVMPARSTTCPMSSFPNEQAKNSNNRRRVKQISDMTEMTTSMSIDDASFAPYMHTPPPSNVSFLRTTHTDVDPADYNPYPAETPVHIDPTSTGKSPAKIISTFEDVPSVPTLTTSSFKEKEKYRSFRQSIKIRLNGIAKVHYIQSKSK